MKTIITISGVNYEIEIKARNIQKKKATQENAKHIMSYIEGLMWESATYNSIENYPVHSNESKNNARSLHQTLKRQGYYKD